jgi:hypothetical protein
MPKNRKYGPDKVAGAIRKVAGKVEDVGDRISGNVRAYRSIAKSYTNIASTRGKVQNIQRRRKAGESIASKHVSTRGRIK